MIRMSETTAMKSRASIKSHPIHPILIAFPIAFYTGTLLTHVWGWLADRADLLQIARWMNGAGVVTAVLAAVPGLIDYLYTVPPQSSGKKRAAKHGLSNTLALLLFLGAALYRRGDDPSQALLLALEIAGMGLTLFAGWLGGTLVYRNQIGVDMRYANAGKWNEARFPEKSGRLEVASTDELKVNAMKLLHVGNQRIVLARTEEGFRAFEDRCTHKGGSLAGGSLACQTVQCPWHGSQFSVRDGSVKAGPAKEGIRTYEVREEGGKVWLVVGG